ncbi:MAG: acyl carrier protein [Alphaproteobacteria bacterium]|nr:acyl carrier protein [Alphaproteobacteria bacterium]
MGLDTVELVMAFEEAFEIDIADEAAERMFTVRDVIGYVYSRVEHSDTLICLSQRAFYRLRRSVQETLGVERSLVRPATSWETLLPVEHRQERWRHLKAAVGADKWPALERSADTRRLMMAAVFGCAAIAFVAVPHYK